MYGKSKAEGEKRMLKEFESTLIIRTSSFFGPWDKYNFAWHLLENVSKNKHFIAVDDITISPTYVPHLADAALDLLIDEETGIWHLTNEGHLSWYDFAVELAVRNGYKKDYIISRRQHEMQWPARRPVYSALHCNRGIQLPSLDHAMNQFVSEKLV